MFVLTCGLELCVHFRAVSVESHSNHLATTLGEVHQSETPILKSYRYALDRKCFWNTDTCAYYGLRNVLQLCFTTGESPGGQISGNTATPATSPCAGVFTHLEQRRQLQRSWGLLGCLPCPVLPSASQLCLQVNKPEGVT